ncbi:MAG TPA: alpha-L-rhamnosidase, partial [Candidatus Dormibacteraeota bacterium]|nr:alpha-L-rhamnosidase [Candidatus Dormibacteraeota bacterium]
MKVFVIKTLSTLALVEAAFAFDSSGRAPAGLLVNGASNPLAIDRETARFTWRSPDTQRRATQTAYQILVSTDPAGLAAEKADWWDSGKMDSDKSASVEYAGKTLAPAKRFWWKVRTWDQTGHPGPYSASAYFDT